MRDGQIGLAAAPQYGRRVKCDLTPIDLAADNNERNFHGWSTARKGPRIGSATLPSRLAGRSSPIIPESPPAINHSNANGKPDKIAKTGNIQGVAGHQWPACERRRKPGTFRRAHFGQTGVTGNQRVWGTALERLSRQPIIGRRRMSSPARSRVAFFDGGLHELSPLFRMPF